MTIMMITKMMMLKMILRGAAKSREGVEKEVTRWNKKREVEKEDEDLEYASILNDGDDTDWLEPEEEVELYHYMFYTIHHISCIIIFIQEQSVNPVISLLLCELLDGVVGEEEKDSSNISPAVPISTPTTATLGQPANQQGYVHQLPAQQ